MTDSSDSEDLPQLSSETFTALQEFYNEQEQREAKLNGILASPQNGDENTLFEEDWQLSQFWYDDDTVDILVNVISKCIPNANGRIALVSSPTLYKKMKEKYTNVTIFEFDERFAAYGNDFVFYDYKSPLSIPRELGSSFDIVIADPPFLSEECLTKTAVTIKFLTKNKMIICTGAVMADLVGRLLDLKKSTMIPAASSLKTLIASRMIQIRYTRNLFLRAICVVYLFAFLSFYIQIPGLYGNNGILPARLVLENSKHTTLSAKVHYQPTLLWLAPYLGLDVQYMMDLLALLGTFLAFTGFVSQKFCTVPTLAGLWSLYFSLYQVGQTFMSTQWDGLLLEAGFLSLLVAPLLPGKRRGSKGGPSDNISFWLVRWLLFRFLLSSGVVKLLSGCPKWWDLTALKFHFESMVLPTPLSWYAHHIPLWLLKLTAVFVNVAEMVLPFLFFAPLRSVRITGFTVQIFLQICIVLTGNFNFRDLLLVTLSISLLDDQFFFGKYRRPRSTKWTILSQVLNITIHSLILYGVYVLYGLKLNGTQIDSHIAFTKDQFNSLVRQAIPLTVFIGIISLGVTVARAVALAVTESTTVASKVGNVIVTVLYALIAVLIFTASTVPLTNLHAATNATVVPSVRTLHTRMERLHVVNSYDMFKRMPGANGRLEIVLEGSNNIEGPWMEYQLFYKPSNVNHSLPFVAPYSPRVDWQMWFAAQSSYQKQPWLMSLAYRLLQGQSEVLNLLDKSHSGFGEIPPKYLRASLYNYKYTAWNQRWQTTWWKRERMDEYFPVFTRDNPALVDYLRSVNVLPSAVPLKYIVHPTWKTILDNVRYVAGRVEASILLWSVFSAGCAIITSTTRSNK
ncbi:uncharacterized protein CBL_11509 [Carabus blaptoides fortunei]